MTTITTNATMTAPPARRAPETPKPETPNLPPELEEAITKIRRFQREAFADDQAKANQRLIEQFRSEMPDDQVQAMRAQILRTPYGFKLESDMAELHPEEKRAVYRTIKRLRDAGLLNEQPGDINMELPRRAAHREMPGRPDLAHLAFRYALLNSQNYARMRQHDEIRRLRRLGKVPPGEADEYENDREHHVGNCRRRRLCSAPTSTGSG